MLKPVALLPQAQRGDAPFLVIMIMVLIVIMVMVVIVIMVVMVIVVIIMIMIMNVGSRDSRSDYRQADRVMRRVGAVAVANGLCRGRSREEHDCAEASYRGSSKNVSVTGHGRRESGRERVVRDRSPQR